MSQDKFIDYYKELCRLHYYKKMADCIMLTSSTTVRTRAYVPEQKHHYRRPLRTSSHLV